MPQNTLASKSDSRKAISKQAAENYQVLNRILELATSQSPLEESLTQCMDQLLSLSWLSILPQAGMFLTEAEHDGTEVLRLVVSRNLDPEIERLCTRVQFGKCLCGGAALTQESIHTTCIDARHETTFIGMAPHGHYNIPIVSKGKTLGVMVFYLPHGSKRCEESVGFLEHVASALAMMITINRQNAELSDKITQLDSQKQALDQHAIVSVTEVDGTILYANGKFCDVTGYTEQELIGQNYCILRSDEQGEAVYQELYDTVSSGRQWQGDTKCRKKNGDDYWVSSTIVPTVDRTGRAQRCVVIQTDISEMKRDQQEIAEKEQRFRLFAESVDEGIMVSVDRVIQDVSPVWAEMFGCKPEYAIGRTVLDFTSEDFRAEVIERISKGETDAIDSIMLRPDGTTFPARVRARFQTINGKTVRYSTILDTSKQKENEAALQDAVAEAERANRVKSDFLASMSHELRTPLNSITGFAQLLEFDRDQPLTDSQKHCVDMILSGGYHLLNLINDVLDLAKIDSGKIEVSIKETSIAEILDSSLRLMQGMSDKHGVQLKIESSPLTERYILADATRIKQVLLNLISNACKYNSDNGQVLISLSERPDSIVRIAIDDTGDGMTEEHLSRLFQPFDRLGAEMTDIEGTGIGLVISKNLMHQMHGEIGVESEPTVGTRFWVDLPLVMDHTGTTTDDVTPDETTDPDTLGHREHSHGTMLYVEDNPNNLKLMELIISHMSGVELISAPTGQLGIEMAQTHSVDLIILDLNLPDMSGFDVLGALRENQGLSDVPIFALTASASEQATLAGIEAGFTRYLTKPIDVAELMAAVIEEMQTESD